MHLQIDAQRNGLFKMLQASQLIYYGPVTTEQAVHAGKTVTKVSLADAMHAAWLHGNGCHMPAPAACLPAPAPSWVFYNRPVVFLQLRGVVRLSMARPPAPVTGKSQYLRITVRAAMNCQGCVAWLPCR